MNSEDCGFLLVDILWDGKTEGSELNNDNINRFERSPYGSRPVVFIAK